MDVILTYGKDGTPDGVVTFECLVREMGAVVDREGRATLINLCNELQGRAAAL